MVTILSLAAGQPTEQNKLNNDTAYPSQFYHSPKPMWVPEHVMHLKPSRWRELKLFPVSMNLTEFRSARIGKTHVSTLICEQLAQVYSGKWFVEEQLRRL
jgi:hypothetical protein